MNKSQKLAVMQIRAKKKVAEMLERHNVAWHGQEPEIIDGKQPPVEEESNGDNQTASN